MPDEEALNVAYKKTFKLALAVSVIRSKPSHLSAKEYARQLANNIKKSEVSWKSKYEKVNSELIDTKQQMVILHLKNESILQQSKGKLDNGNHVHSGGNHVHTDGNHVHIDGNHVHIDGNQVHSGGDQLDKNDTSMSEADTADKMAVNGRFLLSVASFKNWNVLLQNDQRSIATVKTSIDTSLHEFQSCLETISLNEHNLSLISENIRTIVDMVKKDGFSFDTRTHECCSNIVQNLIKIVMTSQVETSLCERLSLIIVLLAQSCPSLRDTVMENLVNVTVAYSALLADSPRFTSLDISKYENMYFICEALRDTFVSTYKMWPLSKCGAYSTQLDCGIVTIANQYPVYAHTVWVTSSLMADAQYDAEQVNPFFRGNLQ